MGDKSSNKMNNIGQYFRAHSLIPFCHNMGVIEIHCMIQGHENHYPSSDCINCKQSFSHGIPFFPFYTSHSIRICVDLKRYVSSSYFTEIKKFWIRVYPYPFSIANRMPEYTLSNVYLSYSQRESPLYSEKMSIFLFIHCIHRYICTISCHIV